MLFPDLAAAERLAALAPERRPAKALRSAPPLHAQQPEAASMELGGGKPREARRGWASPHLPLWAQVRTDVLSERVDLGVGVAAE